MVVNFFYFTIYIAEAFIAYTYFLDNYEIKKSNLNSILLACTLYIIGFSVNYIDKNNFIINMIAFFIINIVYSLVSFYISIKDSLFQSSILLALMFLTEMMVEATASSFLHIPIDAYKTSITALIIFGIICKVLYLTICKMISLLFSYKANNSQNIKKNFLLFLFPLIITIMLSLFLYSSTNYRFSKTLNTIYALVSFLSLLFCCLFFIINQRIQRQESELLNLQSEKQRNEMNKTFYELLEKKNEEQRILVHDIKHHFAAINSMENTTDIKNYIAEVQPELDEHKFIGKTKNKMFDLILDRYASICNDKSINFIVDIRASNLDFIEDKNLVSMLSNLLDNAVEATDKIDNSVIRLSTKRDKNFVILSVVNNCLQKPKANGEKLITTKANSSYHGYGIKSLEKTINKYNGICNWTFDETNKEFHFNILFNRK